MRRTLFYILAFVCVLCISCKETEEVKIKKSGSMRYAGDSYAIGNARLGIDTIIDGQYVSDLVFNAATLNVSDKGISGYGAMLSIRLSLDSAGIADGTYISSADGSPIMLDSSFVRTYPQNGGDTVTVPLAGGEFTAGQSVIGRTFSFAFATTNGDSITGRYEGPQVTDYDIDGDSVGYLDIDTLHAPLQESKIWTWGNLFSPDLYYYEMELLPIDLRYSDDGKFKQGLILSIGFHSDNAERPSDGTYPIASAAENNTVFYGHKEKNVTWGTYWQLFANGTTKSRANVLNDPLTIKWDEDILTLSINLKDQLNNNIKGQYKAKTELVDPFADAKRK